MRADLHVHTHYSDGLLSPQEVVNTAAANGVNVLAITDHDCALALCEGQHFCKQKGIEFVRGTEISAYFGEVKLHTLAYGFNPENQSVKNFFEELKENSYKRADDILNKLKAAGYKLGLEDVERQRYSESSPVHSMHIARAAVERGYASNAFEFYKNFLMRGKVAFSNYGRPSPKRTIEIFTSAGGVCSLAHPGRVELEKQEITSLILGLKDVGLCGIEAVYSTHTKSQTTYFKELAKEYGLFVTGGSDTHFKTGNNKIGVPYFQPAPQLLQKLLN